MPYKSAMCPEPDLNTSLILKTTQRGFAIVSAIFLLVVLTSLGAFMLTFSTTQHATATQDLLATRASQAARAGIEWGTYQALRTATPCAASASLTLAGTLAGFVVTVNCTSSVFTEGASTRNIYLITSTASTGGTVGSNIYVERQFQATVGR